jgi:hypothetical protein
MKIVFILLLLSLIPFISYNQIDICSLDNSHIIIYGKSNIRDYSCDLYDFSNNDKIRIVSSNTNGIYKLDNAIVRLKSNGFTCNNKVMTSDFYESIKGDVYKYITLQFHEFQLIEEIEDNESNLIQYNIPSVISITLAGKKRTYDHRLSSMEISYNYLIIKGSISVTMSEFEVSPPSSLFGAIKVEDEIQIEYSFTFYFN